MTGFGEINSTVFDKMSVYVGEKHFFLSKLNKRLTFKHTPEGNF